MKLEQKSAVVLGPWAILLAGLAVLGSANAGEVRLQWDPNSEADLAGYRVYYGTVSGQYGIPVAAGLQTSYTVSNLAAGTYYFAVTAINNSGVESGFSNEVSATVSGPAVTSCDQNGDGVVNVLDLQVLSNVITGSQSCQGACDLNKDGRVDSLDLQILANVILGVQTCP